MGVLLGHFSVIGSCVLFCSCSGTGFGVLWGQFGWLLGALGVTLGDFFKLCGLLLDCTHSAAKIDFLRFGRSLAAPFCPLLQVLIGGVNLCVLLYALGRL